MPGNPVKWTAALASPISNPNSTSSPGVLNWMPGQQLPSGALSIGAPALVTSGGKLWCVHDDNGGNNFWYTNYDFNQWTEESGIPNNLTYNSVSLYDNSANMWCIYTGGDTYINYIATNDAARQNWDAPFRLAPAYPQSDSGPSQMAGFNGKIYAAIRGNKSTGIWILVIHDQRCDQYQITIPGHTVATLSGPALCTFQNKLWCVFHGTDNGFYTTTSDDGQSWSAPVGTGSAATDSQPALCVVPGQQGNPDTLLCVFGDSRGYNGFWYLYNTSGDPGDWVGGAFIPPLHVSRINGTGMGLAVWNDVIFAAYLST